MAPGWHSQNHTIRVLKNSPLIHKFNFSTGLWQNGPIYGHKKGMKDDWYVFPRYFNNLHIARGIQLNVRSYDDLSEVISKEEYRVGSNHSSLLWFRPIDHLPKGGEEKNGSGSIPDAPTLSSSHFLPRCLRENLYTDKMPYLQIMQIKCSVEEQEPVNEDFYDVLGIPKGQYYVFDFVIIW